MGVRQALGYLFSEIWFAVKEEWLYCRKHSIGFSDTLMALGKGFQRGFETGMSSKMTQKFLSGSLAGVLASVTTTVINRLHTTAKNTVKVIRQCWASITEAISILFLNPDGYFMGDRLSAVVKTISVGASVVLGTVVEEKVTDSLQTLMPDGCTYVGNFVGALVTGLLSCSILLFIDHDKNVKKLVSFLNEIPTIDKQLAYYKEQAQKLATFSAQIMEIDLATFRKETTAYQELSLSITTATSPRELNRLLKQHFQDKNIVLPWSGEFDDFMKNKNNRLVFQ